MLMKIKGKEKKIKSQEDKASPIHCITNCKGDYYETEEDDSRYFKYMYGCNIPSGSRRCPECAGGGIQS